MLNFCVEVEKVQLNVTMRLHALFNVQTTVVLGGIIGLLESKRQWSKAYNLVCVSSMTCYAKVMHGSGQHEGSERMFAICLNRSFLLFVA